MIKRIKNWFCKLLTPKWFNNEGLVAHNLAEQEHKEAVKWQDLQSKEFTSSQQKAGSYRMARLTPEQRTELACNAAKVRWDRYYASVEAN